MLSLFFVSLTCLAALIRAAPAPEELHVRAANPTVSIASGVLVGTATGVLNQPSVTGLVNAYLGVPYAAAPIGDLRFAPPAPKQAWGNTPRRAQALAPSCLQQFASGDVGARTKKYFNNPIDYPPPPESEDCLYLNVYAPQTASPQNLKPVMFWIFGGNLQIGSAYLTAYNGSSLAVTQDVVVVAINYRTNIFGFSNSPEIPFGKQNSGFLDQRFALQWVQNNIRAFGGDPSKVTIFGESAGAYSVKQLLAVPPSPLPFRAAILESQQIGLFQLVSAGSYPNVLQHFGCSTAASPLACIRKVDAVAIRDYISSQNLQFAPVEGDGTSVGSKSLTQIVNGQFATVPVLIGTNLDEFRVFLNILGISSASSSDISNTVKQVTGLDISGVLSDLVAAYAAQGVTDTYLLLGRILTDLIFTCTTSSLSNAIALAGRQPVWRYRFNGVFPNVSPFPNIGAYHSVEIPEAWGTYPLVNSLGPATTTQIQLSKYMQGAWAGFAKNPSGGPGWVPLESTILTQPFSKLGDLGASSNPGGETTVSVQNADYACPIYQPILLLSGMAY